MSTTGAILLTGATGFLGRYLLRDFLASGRTVAVLARDTSSASAAERVRAIVARWGDILHTKLPPPLVLTGDLCTPGLGLTAADRSWLAAHCQCVVHAAADVSLRPAPRSDPWTTNVVGTQHLLDLCCTLGIADLHHVSTAFVCGDRSGLIREDELDCGQHFHNDYEKSKCAAERRVRAARGLRATIYRPSVIVGDSRTGYTSSYHGFYRFLELAARLAGHPSSTSKHKATQARRLPLRLPFTGEESRNLVPVDWVARAVVQIVSQPRGHGRAYHLVARTPVPVRQIKEVAEELLGIEGVRWAGDGPPDNASLLEELFLAQLREFSPYFRGDPTFDCRNTLAALPKLPAPPMDRALLRRLIQLAIADRWGRPHPRQPQERIAIDCARYVENFFPQSLRRSTLARIPVEITVGLDVRGEGGGQWSFRCSGGDLVTLRRGGEQRADVLYRMDVGTFEAVVGGRQTPQEAFLGRRIEIAGDIEKALKLAFLFEHFVAEFPYQPLQHGEAWNAALQPA
jgi:nucleoside-diphosphate-sugar epimerase